MRRSKSRPISAPVDLPNYDEEIQALLSTPEGRRELSKHSPAFFDSYYCGMIGADHRTFWFQVFEEARGRARKRASKERVLLLAPRKHGKTEAVTSYITRAVCLNRDIHILWICATSSDAEKRFGKVKQLLKSDRILEDWTLAPEEGYGPFADTVSDSKNRKDKWTANELVIMRPTVSVHATIYAIGSGTAPTGGHYDLIVCDDLENEDSCNTAALRNKTRSWFFSELWPTLNPGGTMIVIGTKKHSDDIYSHLKANAMWVTIEQQAIIEWPERWEPVTEYNPLTKTSVVVGVKVEGDAKVLWNDIAKVLGGNREDGEPMTGIEYLLAERASMTAQLFAREFQHQVQDDDATPFAMEYLDLAKQKGKHLRFGQIPPEVRFVVQGWDISLVKDAKKAQEKDRDFTVGVTLGLDDLGNRYLLGLRRKRGMSIPIFRSLVQAEYLKFGGAARVSKVAVEKNSFGTLHFAEVQGKTDLPLVPHDTNRNKTDPWEGVPSLQNLFESGKFILPYADDCQETRGLVDVLVTELWGLGTEKHDDTVMALWIAETVLRGTQFEYSFGVGDISEEEEEELKELIGDGEDDAFWRGQLAEFESERKGSESDESDESKIAALGLWGNGEGDDGPWGFF